MNTWFNYRVVWGAHPWLAVYFGVVVLVLAASVWATVAAPGPLMILFIPSLGGLYLHHLMVMKRLPE